MLEESVRIVKAPVAGEFRDLTRSLPIRNIRYTLNAWLELVTSLPTEHATERMRAWRALKATGAVVLRDGVYLLPSRPDLEAALSQLAADIDEAGGSAHVLRVETRDAGQAEALRALFDRTKEYAELAREVAGVRTAASAREPTALRRQVRTLRRQFEALAAIDFFPGEARAQVESALIEAEAAAEELLEPGEPRAATGPIPRLDRSRYRRRVWATRKAPWVDRLACAWLIKRHIDPAASFVWVETPADLPKSVVGFDFDGAPFTHVDNRVTFEVMLRSFGLDTDAALLRLAEVVHFLDVGGIPTSDAPGIGTMLAGARRRSRDDDHLLKLAIVVFDLVHAAYAEDDGRSTHHLDRRTGGTP